MSRIGRAHRDDDSECQSPCVERSDAKRFRRTFSTRSSFISIFATVIAASSLTFTLWHRHSSHLNLFPFTAEARSLNGLSSEHSEAFSDPTKPMAEVKKKQQEPKEEPQRRTRNLDRTGVPEAMTTIRQDWSVVINNFMDTANIEMFSARKIREHFYSDVNNIQSTCLLVSIKNGNVTFTEKFSPKRHSRAASAKYIIEHIVKKKGSSLHGATFLVMLSDGHRPFIPTFGSARHWQSWNMMIPVPLGNSRGANIEWGTPLQGWDSYIDATITNGHKNYSWTSKREKAVFRGSLGMQKYTLGSCNEENGGKCVRATRWSQVNRGALYVKTQKEPELFDIAFSQHKLKVDSPPKQFEGAPPPSQTIKFQDFQKFKYILNVGSNQDWAERLRSLLFMNSAIVIHQAETQEFFTPLLEPWIHYIPTDLHFTDLVKNIKWARDHDQFVQQIVRNQNAFADRYITERSMQQYWEVALQEFSIRQIAAGGFNSGSKY